MNSFKIRQGGRLDLQITTDAEDAVSATLVMQDSEGATHEFTQLFVDLVADFQDEEEISDLPLGAYEYQINENYETGQPQKFPDAENCGGNCSFPTITICESLDEEGSS